MYQYKKLDSPWILTKSCDDSKEVTPPWNKESKQKYVEWVEDGVVVVGCADNDSNGMIVIK